MQRKYYKYTTAYMRYLKYRHEVQDCTWILNLKCRLPLGCWKGNENFFKSRSTIEISGARNVFRV